MIAELDVTADEAKRNELLQAGAEDPGRGRGQRLPVRAGQDRRLGRQARRPVGELADPGERPDGGELGGLSQPSPDRRTALARPRCTARACSSGILTRQSRCTHDRLCCPTRFAASVSSITLLVASHRRLRGAGNPAGRSGAPDARHERHARTRSPRCASRWGSISPLLLRYLAWIGGLLDRRFRPLLHLFGAGHRTGRANGSSCRCRWR